MDEDGAMNTSSGVSMPEAATNAEQDTSRATNAEAVFAHLAGADISTRAKDSDDIATREIAYPTTTGSAVLAERTVSDRKILTDRQSTKAF